jgi:hypothetical protein
MCAGPGYRPAITRGCTMPDFPDFIAGKGDLVHDGGDAPERAQS